MKVALVPGILRKTFITFFAFFAFVAALVIMANEAFAESASNVNSDETLGGERVTRAPAAASSNRVSRKRYAGGADEDDLQVQASLPLPSRTLDGSAAVSAPNGGDGETASETPAND
jgi:hypothetical protein